MILEHRIIKGFCKTAKTSLKTPKTLFLTTLFYEERKTVQNKECKWSIIKEKVHLIISSSPAFLLKPHFKVRIKRYDKLLVIFIKSWGIFFSEDSRI
jgi:hypothetical protein